MLGEILFKLRYFRMRDVFEAIVDTQKYWNVSRASSWQHPPTDTLLEAVSGKMASGTLETAGGEF